MKALSKFNQPQEQFIVLNLKRWPKSLDRQVKAAAAMRDMTKYEFITRAVRDYLKK
jgi:hypothetical protein